MVDLTISRKQRLRTLEKEIRDDMEKFYYTGMKLKEIRDDLLYKEDGFETWEEYCRKRWELSKQHVYRLITAAEYRQVIPSNRSGDSEWTEWSIRELTRIEDKNEAARVAKKIVDRVDKEGTKLSARFVAKVVDEELGISKSKPERKHVRGGEGGDGVDLRQYLSDTMGIVQATLKMIRPLTDDEWTLFIEDNPETVKRLIAACRSLADFLEDVQQ